ncbi:hypothetical protein KFU94_05890 [Chloroflexi bacterium TSY]|nr:hypothetical protein [Chloroflexi bacterium TSY]
MENIHFTTIESIIQICRLVDGLPLGLEMAASWLRSLDCATIVRELSNTLDMHVLSTNIEERHRTLRAVFDYSWSLLGEHERSMLLHLSIFWGTFDLAAAKGVGGISLFDLSRLVDAAFLHRIDADHFHMHEVMRQGVEEKRHADKVLNRKVHQAHCDYYARWLLDFDVAWRKQYATPSIDGYKRNFEGVVQN